MIVVGLGALAWTLVVWRWGDPFTSLYTAREQRHLAERYDALIRSAPLAAATPTTIAARARSHRLATRAGDPVGRITIPRLGLRMILVNGTDQGTLKKGPGRHLRSFMPGEGKLVYVAGHRTTYLAPFARIEQLRKGDRISLETPYGVFGYTVTGQRIVEDDDTSVLRSLDRETLRLQSCHPRFFASHRFIVYANPSA